jgi:hypothetical protein
MLDRAKSLIVSEISEVMQLTAANIEDRVNQQLEKCFVMKARAQQRAEARAAAKPAPAKAMAAKTPTRITKPARQARAS